MAPKQPAEQQRSVPQHNREAPSRVEPAAPPGSSPGDLVARLLTLQRAAGNTVARSFIAHQPGVQWAPAPAAGGAGPAVRAVLAAPGAPLSDGVRADMEQRLGNDFSDVVIHTGPAAEAAAGAVDAQAFTAGSHVVLGPRTPDPSSSAGAHLLAHELAHVVQQGMGPVESRTWEPGLRVSDPSDRSEREADRIASRAMEAPSRIRRAPVLQRTVSAAAMSRASRILTHSGPPMAPAAPAPGAAGTGAPEMVVQRVVTQAHLTTAVALLGGATAIVVVPTSFQLSGANPAITIKRQNQATLYQRMVEAKWEEFDQSLNMATIQGMVGLNTILVKESVLGYNEALKRAIIWHEQGHVLYDILETGRVYLHELTSLRNAGLPPADTMNVVTGRRAAYQAAKDPGVSDMLAELNTNWAGWNAPPAVAPAPTAVAAIPVPAVAAPAPAGPGTAAVPNAVPNT